VGEEDEEEYGCEYCRNDGRLNPNNCCPKCDAWYPDDDACLPIEEDDGHD
jgi:hypothetical protein